MMSHGAGFVILVRRRLGSIFFDLEGS